MTLPTNNLNSRMLNLMNLTSSQIYHLESRSYSGSTSGFWPGVLKGSWSGSVCVTADGDDGAS